MRRTEATAESVPPSNVAAWAARTTFSLLATVALYVAPFAYFFTACGQWQGLVDRLGWAAFCVVVTVVVFPVWFALGFAAVFTAVLALSRGERSCRLRNRIVPVTFGVLAVGAMTYGAFVPARCTLF